MAEKKTHLGDRELFTSAMLARALGVSRARINQWDSHELIPAPVKFPDGDQRIRRWRKREILAWINADMPPRSRWVWEPPLPRKLDELIQQKHRELHRLQQQVQAMKEGEAT